MPGKGLLLFGTFIWGILVFVRNDGSAVRHDGDGVVFLAFVFHFLLGELPCFLDGSDRDLVRLSDGFKVLRLGDQDDGVLVGHAEEIECDEEWDGEVFTERFFHIGFGGILEAVEISGRFIDVRGFHDGDDDAAFLGDDIGWIVAFAALIEGNVFRIAAGAGKDDVGFVGVGDLLGLVDELGAFEPCFVGVTADHAADLAFGIDDGVNEEGRFYHVGGFLHVVRYRVVIKEGGAGLRVDAGAEFFTESVAVVDLDGLISGNAREDQLAAAAVACEEVRGDAVDDDDLIRFDGVLIQPDRSASLGVADMDELVHLLAAMLVELHAMGQLFTDDSDVFFRGLFSVGALREEDADVIIRDAAAVQFIDDVDDVLIGMVPDAGDISADDADLVAFGNDFGERLAADRVTHTFQGSGFDVAGRSRSAFKDVEDMFLRQGNFLGGLAKTEFKFF